MAKAQRRTLQGQLEAVKIWNSKFLVISGKDKKKIKHVRLITNSDL